MSSSYQIQQLLEKTRNGDPDFRYMALLDMRGKVTDPGFSIDDSTENQLVEQVLTMFADNNSEVKSIAAKTISILVSKVKEDRVQTIIERLTVMTSGKDDVRDIASLALKTVVQEIPPESKLANTACTKLAPKILVQLRNVNDVTDSSQDVLIQLIEVLGDIYARFDQTIRSLPNAQSDGLAGLTVLLNDSRGAVRKRVIRALGNLVACSGESVFASLVEKEVKPALSSSDDEQLKTAISLCSVLASSVPRRMGKRLGELVPGILAAASRDDEELKEVALQSLETLLARCPSESAAFVSEITDLACKYVKYDPNYAGDDRMDEDDANGTAGGDEADGEDGDQEDEEEDEEDYADEYDDDDDVSWKVRRASVKILGTAIDTRLDLLSTFYRTIAPVLVNRFSEREETVKVEIWNTYSSILRQTGIWAGAGASNPVAGGSSARSLPEDPATPGGRAASPANSLKRKRAERDGGDSPLSNLQQQAPAVSKAIIRQMATGKSIAVRQAGFHLLHELVRVLHGGLDTNMAALLPTVETVLKASDSGSVATHAGGSTTNLKIQVLDFLALLFRTHSVRSVQPHLSKLVPLITSAMSDRSPKVAAETFAAASDLVKAMRPLPAHGSDGMSSSVSSPGSGATAAGSSSQQLRSIFDATVKGLSRTDADQEVRERGIVCLGDLVVHAGSDFGSDLQQALQILKDRLRNENTRLVSLSIVSQIAESPSSSAILKDAFLEEVTLDAVSFLRKTNKLVQAASFSALEQLLRRAGSQLSGPALKDLVASLQPFLASPDLNLARALNILSLTIDAQPQLGGELATECLPATYDLVVVPQLASAGHAADALQRFFSTYVHATGNGKDVVKRISDIGAGSQGNIQAAMVGSRCLGAVFTVIAQQDGAGAQAILKETTSNVKSKKISASSLCLGLLTLGEIGRSADLSKHADVFDAALGHLTNSSEDVRSAAAFAIGNMAAGNPTTFLQPLLVEIEKASKDDRKLHLLLSSVKEVLSHGSPSALAELADAFWSPLFQICETASAQQQSGSGSATTAGGASTAAASSKAGDEARLDGTRNLAAECLGKITLTNPAVYLKQLQARLQAPSAGTRLAVITAIRFTFTDESSAYDDLLAPLIVQFLSLMHDPDLSVRRLAVSSLTSAAHNKPQLVRDHLVQLQPLLYDATKVDPTLVHEVTMGPFKVKVDDGLPIRKAAYQCMYTLLETCLNKLDLNSYIDIVVAGLSDDDDIKVSCYLMLVKLSNTSPNAVIQRLDAAAQPLDGVLKQKLKETAVKQEVEKLAEMQRSVLRTMAALLPLVSEAATPRFAALVSETRRNPLWSAEFRTISESAAENRTNVRATSADRMDID